MTKQKSRSARSAQQSQSNSVNWGLIGGIVGGGALLLIILVLWLARGEGGGVELSDLATRQSATATAAVEQAQAPATELPAYCERYPDRCVREGSADAPVTMFEISDYGCSHCKNYNLDNAPAIAERYIETGQLQLVILPSSLIRGQTMDSAVATLCAADQGAGVVFHQQLFRYQAGRLPDEADQIELAQELGLDEQAFRQCLRDPAKLRAAQDTTTFIQGLGVDSTPTFFVNGEKISGNNMAAIEQAIRSSATQ